MQANILVDDEERARISDFGLARIISGEQRTGLTTDTSHTGTLRYLAYELVNTEGHIVSTKEGDVYALGCLALEVSNHRGLFRYGLTPALFLFFVR
jgi:serine/threonine protein kinase